MARGSLLALKISRPLILLLLIPGCKALVARAVATAPNQGRVIVTNEDDVPRDLPPGCSARHQRCDVGFPPASLSAWVIDPASGGCGAEPAPRATVVLLHGFYGSKRQMLRYAMPLLEKGYRTVLVDLRGHGRSTGEWVGYGAFEAEDLSQLLDELERGRFLREPVGVLGISYGAAVAIQLAGRDPRVRSVVAVAPFTSLEDVVPRYVRLFLPFWGWFASPAAIHEAVLGAGVRGGFDPALASPIEAIRRAAARTLLLHGEDDFLIDRSHSERLHAAQPDRSQLVLLPGVGHNGAFRDPEGKVSGEAIRWFESWLAE